MAVISSIRFKSSVADVLHFGSIFRKWTAVRLKKMLPIDNCGCSDRKIGIRFCGIRAGGSSAPQRIYG
jgi:hypothetical protein